MLEKIKLAPLHLLFSIIAYCPTLVLRWLSKLVYFILYHLLSYRKKVVQVNIKHALSHLSEVEREKEVKAFYKHLSEIILEIIQGFYISSQKLQKQIIVSEKAQNLLNQIEQRNQQIVLMLGHYGNWEWPLLILQDYIRHQAFALYAPLSSPSMNNYMLQRRERFGAMMLDASQPRQILPKLKSQKSILAVVGDQSPTGRTNVYETDFLSLPTRFFTGGEKIARKLHAAVIYVRLEKLDFAKYQVHLELISENAALEPEDFITKKYTQLLEHDILKHPEFWIWSHKRWKNLLPYSSN